MADDLWGDFDQAHAKPKASAAPDDVWADFDAPAKHPAQPLKHFTPTAPDLGVMQRVGDAIFGSSGDSESTQTLGDQVAGSHHLSAFAGLPEAAKSLLTVPAETGQSILRALGGPVAGIVDKIAAAGQRSRGEPVDEHGFTDNTFRGIDQLTQPSVDMFQSDRKKMGAGSRFVATGANVLGSIPEMIGMPEAFLADSAMTPATQAVDQGKDLKTALELGGVNLGVNTIGMKMPATALPILDRLGVKIASPVGRLAARVGTGGVAQTGIGIGAAEADKQVLGANGYADEAAQTNPLDVENMLHSLLLGGAFGVHEHVTEHAPLGAPVSGDVAPSTAIPTDAVAARAARAQDALDRNAAVLGHGAAPTDDLAAHLPPELIQAAASVLGHPEPAQSAAALARPDGTPAAQTEPVPAEAPPTPSLAEPAGQTDFAQQAAAAMRMRAQAEAARTPTAKPEDSDSAQPVAERAGSTPAAGDLHSELARVDERPLPADDTPDAPLDIRYGKKRATVSREEMAAREVPHEAEPAAQVAEPTTGDAPRPAIEPAHADAEELTDADLSDSERASIDRLRVDRGGIRAKLSRDNGEADADGLKLRPAVDAAVGHAGIKVEYLRGQEGLPDKTRKQLQDQTKARGSEQRTSGLYVPGDPPRVFLDTGVVNTPEKAAFTAAHEIAGHHGLRSLAAKDAKVGNRTTHEALNHALDIALQNPTVAAVADSMMRRRSSTDRLRMAEEALADLAAATRTGQYDEIARRHGVNVPQAQRATLRGAVARFVERVKAVLGASGAKFTDAQVHELLENAWQAAKESGAAQTGGEALESTEAGPFGPIYHADDFATGIDQLMSERGGELRDALFHPSIGHVDVIYGKEGTAADDFEDGYGLAKIAAKHPEVDLHSLAEEVLAAGDPVVRGNIAVFDTPSYTVVVKRDWRGDPKNWLLTAFDPKAKPASGSTRIGAAATGAETRSRLDAGSDSLRPENERGNGEAEPLESTEDAADFAPHATDDPPVGTVADLPSRRPGESQDAFTRRINNVGGEELRTLQAETDKIKSIGRANFKAMLAKQARMGDVADAVFHEYRKLFDSADKAATLRSIDQWETGGTVHDPDARNFFKVMDGMFADRIARLRAAKPEALKDLVENYFPHLWEDSSKATQWYQSNTKRPLDGNKSFLKQRTWGTIREGMDSGLKPVSYNPVDLALLKLQQMDKFITFHEFKNDLKARGWLKQVKAGDKLPEGYATIDSPAFKGSHAFIIKGENGAKDEAASAHWNWAVPESIAKDVNNYLSPSLYRFKAWKSLRYVQNVLMSTRLGFSAFHAGFTTTDNLVMHVDVAGRRLLTGDIAGGLQLLVKAPLTTIISPYEGGVLNKAWRGEHATDPHTAALLTALEEGGATRLQGAQQMDFNNALPGLIRSIRQKSASGALKRVLPAIGEASSYLIHQKLVPAQKMAARVMLLKFELDRLAGKLGKDRGDYAGIIEAMHPDSLKQISGKVVNLVDDRLGQMNYDNQFWNKTAREVAQGLIGAVGWQVGTLRTVTGGVADLRRLWKPEALVAPLDKEGSLTGDLGRVSGRLTYLLSLGMTMGGTAALTQYLLTGQGPDELKDYFFPKTGRKNPDGGAERLQFPSYWMDHYKLATHPLQTAEHKIHPSIGLLMEAINNQDYWGVQLRDEDAPWYEQAAQIGEHIAKGFVPYSITGQKKLDDSDASIGQRAANFVGVTTAPSTVSRSAFQSFVSEKAAASAPQGGRTQDQADHSDAMHAIEDSLRKGESPDMSGLTAKEQKAARKAAELPVPALRFKRLSLEDKLRAWDKATPEERKTYGLAQLIVGGDHKHMLALDEAIAKLPEEDQETVRAKIQSIRGGPAEGYPDEAPTVFH